MFSQLRIRDMCTFYCCGHINKNKTKDITKPFFRKRMTIPTFLNKVSRCKGPKQSTVKKNNLVKSRCSIPVNSWLFSSSSSLSPLSQIFYHPRHHRYCYPSAFSDTSTNRQAALFPKNTPNTMNTLESELKSNISLASVTSGHEGDRTNFGGVLPGQPDGFKLLVTCISSSPGCV